MLLNLASKTGNGCKAELKCYDDILYKVDYISVFTLLAYLLVFLVFKSHINLCFYLVNIEHLKTEI